jgi:hypothetical protein
MRKIVRTIAVLAISAGSLGVLATAPAMASQASQPQFKYPLCNPAHPIYPCQNDY